MNKRRPKKGIYKLTFPDQSVYIGATTDISTRKRHHKNYVKSPYAILKTPPLLMEAFDKFGAGNFIFEILVKDNSLDREGLGKLEKTFIRMYEEQGIRVLNITYSKSNAHKRGKVFDPVKRTTDFQRNGIDRKIKAKPHTGKNIRSIVATFETGKIMKFPTVKETAAYFSVDSMQIIRSLKAGQFNGIDETILLRYSRKRKDNVPRHSNGVIQMFDNGAEIHFPTLKDAAKTTGINSSNISNACSERIKTAGGFRWKYADNKAELPEKTAQDIIAEMQAAQQQSDNEAKASTQQRKDNIRNAVDRIRKGLK